MTFAYVQFETSTRCGGRCIICPHGRGMMKPRPSMSNSLIEKIIKELVPRTNLVFPYLNGEPTMEPRLINIIKRCKEANPNVQIEIYTTLQGLNTLEQLTQLVDSQITIRVSFYGPTRELLKKYQPGLDYDLTKDRIHALLAGTQHRIHMGLPTSKVSMDYITTPELMERWASFNSYWRGAGAEIRRVRFDSWCGRIQGEGLMNDSKWEQTSAKVCPRLNGITILSTGEVVPCCLSYDERVLGNIATQTIEEIMAGKEWRSIREEQARGEFTGICGPCDHRRYI